MCGGADGAAGGRPGAGLRRAWRRVIDRGRARGRRAGALLYSSRDPPPAASRVLAPADGLPYIKRRAAGVCHAAQSPTHCAGSTSVSCWRQPSVVLHSVLCATASVSSSEHACDAFGAAARCCSDLRRRRRLLAQRTVRQSQLCLFTWLARRELPRPAIRPSHTASGPGILPL